VGAPRDANHPSRPARADAPARAAYDDALRGVRAARAPAAPCSQHGLARGVTVRVHGQRGPAPPPRAAAPRGGEAAPDAWRTEAGWAAQAREAAGKAACAAAAALAAGQPARAVELYTDALRMLGACGPTAGLGFAELYRGRAAAHAVAGEERRAEEDLAEAAEVE